MKTVPNWVIEIYSNWMKGFTSQNLNEKLGKYGSFMDGKEESDLFVFFLIPPRPR